MRRLLSTLLCTTLPLSTFAQVPTLRIGTQIVAVDVTVTDGHGNPVHNLKKSDFSISEDSSTQTVSHFEEHIAPDTAQLAKLPKMPDLGPNIYTNFTVTPEDGPINVLLIDYLNTPVENQAHSREQLIAFLKTLKPGTRLAIFGLNARLVLLQGFTSDPKKLLAALSAPKGNSQTSPLLGDKLGTETGSDEAREVAVKMGNDTSALQMVSRMQEVEAMLSAQQQQMRAQLTLSAMNQLARYLSGIPGRKNLIWFSASFPISILPDTTLTNHANLGDRQDPFAVVASSANEFRETASLLSRSQVAVYPVDSRGLFTDGLMDTSLSGHRNALNPAARSQDLDTFTTQTFDSHATMNQMAEATGGHAYLNTNSLGDAVERAINSGSNYYTLTYSPTDKTQNGQFRKITVHLASGNYTLTYRKGYYADLPNVAKPQLVQVSSKSKQAPGPSNDPMRAAMQFGAPDPTQIVFKALLVANPNPANKPADGNIASPKSKPPYRIVTVAYAVNPGDVSMPAQSDGNRQVNLQFAAVVYDQDGQLINQQANPVNIIAKPEAYQQFMKEGMRYQQQIAVPEKGHFFIRVGVHDIIGNTVGAVELPTDTIGTATN